MDFDELNDALAESNARARNGRAIAEVGFVVTAALVVLFVFVFVATPQCGGMMCPMFESPPGSVGDVSMGLGFGGLAVGLLWMWRIVRADRDPDARSWRYLHRP